MINTVRRLEHLRDCMVLQQDPETAYGEFDMDYWARGMGAGMGVPITPRKAKHMCGFAACALGNACLYPPLRKIGFRLENHYFWGLSPRYEDRTGFGAAVAGFGISGEEAEYLFSPGNYEAKNIKPHHVIKRIDVLLKKYRRKA